MDRDLLLSILVVFIILIYWFGLQDFDKIKSKTKAEISEDKCVEKFQWNCIRAPLKFDEKPVKGTKNDNKKTKLKSQIKAKEGADEELVREIENNVTKVGLKGLKSGAKIQY